MSEHEQTRRRPSAGPRPAAPANGSGAVDDAPDGTGAAGVPADPGSGAQASRQAAEVDGEWARRMAEWTAQRAEEGAPTDAPPPASYQPDPAVYQPAEDEDEPPRGSRFALRRRGRRVAEPVGRARHLAGESTASVGADRTDTAPDDRATDDRATDDRATDDRATDDRPRPTAARATAPAAAAGVADLRPTGRAVEPGEESPFAAALRGPEEPDAGLRGVASYDPSLDSSDDNPADSPADNPADNPADRAVDTQVEPDPGPEATADDSTRTQNTSDGDAPGDTDGKKGRARQRVRWLFARAPGADAGTSDAASDPAPDPQAASPQAAGPEQSAPTHDRAPESAPASNESASAAPSGLTPAAPSEPTPNASRSGEPRRIRRMLAWRRPEEDDDEGPFLPPEDQPPTTQARPRPRAPISSTPADPSGARTAIEPTLPRTRPRPAGLATDAGSTPAAPPVADQSAGRPARPAGTRPRPAGNSPPPDERSASTGSEEAPTARSTDPEPPPAVRERPAPHRPEPPTRGALATVTSLFALRRRRHDSNDDTSNDDTSDDDTSDDDTTGGPPADRAQPESDGKKPAKPRGRKGLRQWLRGSRMTRTITRIVVVVAIVAVAALLLRDFVVSPYYIPSQSMEPTLVGCPGCTDDRVLVDKISYRFHEPEQGDIVVFDRPQRVQDDTDYLIKRVVAVGGQTISLHDGLVYVDNRRLVETYLRKACGARPTRSLTGRSSWQVPEGDVFVMGDNRCDSTDSRYFGPIPDSTVVGRAFMIFWPVSRIDIL